ncbi:Six-bladed beta-propeller TolB-like protein [Dioscorea alata]|nr:Six-bladed beta-propeller TolB-like protein [Dioscorea alata]
MKDHPRRCSGLSEAQHTLVPQAQVLNFINQMFSEVEGTNHRWLNKIHNEKLSFNKDGSLIVFLKTCELNSTLCDNREVVAMLERVKLLQQRYQGLSIFGLLCVNSVNSIAIQTQITQAIMENYVTFPILLFDKDFPEMLNGGCYLLFEGSRNRFLHHELDVDIGIIVKEIEEFYSLNKSGAVMVQNPTVSGTPQRDEVKEPCIYPMMRNLLLSYPGCIAVDENGGRTFISDCNNHRVIITDEDGKIIDCIGSSPGFEDGEFELAKLYRPAASVFDNAENSLYIVDSENNAIRRADMERRVLGTVYPVPVQKSSRIWSWIMDKLGFQKESALTSEVVDLDGVTLPWHLVKLGGDDLLIINRSFEMAWITNMSTGEIKRVVRGTKTITEMYGHLILERVPSFKDVCWNSFQQRLVHYFSLEGIPYASLMSSIASFKNYTLFCDAAAQKVLKCHRESRQVECVQFSNLGILGLPYWLVSPPERIFRSGSSCYQWNEHLRPFSVLPGRCNIKVNVDIPMETELIAPLDENCIWRQARGSAAELSRLDGPVAGSEKVGVAQQWFDELDNLAFSRPEDDLNPEEEKKYSSKCSQDSDKVHFNCTVNVSPGIGEVVVSAVLYLKLKKAQGTGGQNFDSMRLLGLKSDDSIKPEEEVCMKLLSDTCGDLQDIVFMKPLHLRIRLDCGDHPSADTQKEIISTETNLEISISLD